MSIKVEDFDRAKEECSAFLLCQASEAVEVASVERAKSNTALWLIQLWKLPPCIGGNRIGFALASQLSHVVTTSHIDFVTVQIDGAAVRATGCLHVGTALSLDSAVAYLEGVHFCNCLCRITIFGATNDISSLFESLNSLG